MDHWSIDLSRYSTCVCFQVFNYLNVRCRADMFDKDVIMLQVKCMLKFVQYWVWLARGRGLIKGAFLCTKRTSHLHFTTRKVKRWKGKEKTSKRKIRDLRNRTCFEWLRRLLWISDFYGEGGKWKHIETEKTVITPWWNFDETVFINPVIKTLIS